MTSMDTKLPGWFWAAAALLVLWDIAGVAAFYAHIAVGETGLAAMSAYDRQAYLALPGWFNWSFAMATWPALFGSIALLLRSRFALPLYLVSLAGVVVQFGWVFGATDLIAVKGAAATVPFPLFIFVLALVQIWFARMATQRGWLR